MNGSLNWNFNCEVVVQYYHLYVNSSGDFMIQHVDKNNFGFENMNYNMINFHLDIQ